MRRVGTVREFGLPVEAIRRKRRLPAGCRHGRRNDDIPSPLQLRASAILVRGLAVSFGAFSLLCSRWLALHLSLRIL